MAGKSRERLLTWVFILAHDGGLGWRGCECQQGLHSLNFFPEEALGFIIHFPRCGAEGKERGA